MQKEEDIVKFSLAAGDRDWKPWGLKENKGLFSHKRNAEMGSQELVR